MKPILALALNLARNLNLNRALNFRVHTRSKIKIKIKITSTSTSTSTSKSKITSKSKKKGFPLMTKSIFIPLLIIELLLCSCSSPPHYIITYKTNISDGTFIKAKVKYTVVDQKGINELKNKEKQLHHYFYLALKHQKLTDFSQNMKAEIKLIIRKTKIDLIKSRVLSIELLDLVVKKR